MMGATVQVPPTDTVSRLSCWSAARFAFDGVQKKVVPAALVQVIAEAFKQSEFVEPSVTRNVVSVTPHAVQVPAARTIPLIRVSVIPTVGLYIDASIVAPRVPIPVEPLNTIRSPPKGVGVGCGVAVGTSVGVGCGVGVGRPNPAAQSS